MILVDTFSIAAAGTHSNYLSHPGYRLVGLVVPAIDSSTIGFEASVDGETGPLDIFTNTGTPAAVTLGTADTGSKVVAVPEDVGRISAVIPVRLQVASQTSGAVAVKALFEKVGG